MNGWDVSSLVNVPFVNNAIRTQGASPPSMKIATDVLSVKAQFGTWQITTGGAPSFPMFNLPLLSISGTASKKGQILATFDYQNLEAKIQLVLKFIDGDAGGQDLVVDSRNPPTSVVSLLDGKGQALSQTNGIDDAFIQEALVEWLDKNLSQFNHVFASVALDPGANSKSQWAFCKPAVTAHTFISGTSLEDSFLGLLYNTAGNKTPGAVAQVDPSFIPPGCEAAFMLSPAMFLSNFLGPSIAAQFGIPDKFLSIDSRQMRVDLVGGVQINLPEVTASDGNRYRPVLNSLESVVESSTITLYATSSTVVLDEWYGTVTAHCSSQCWLTMGLDKSGKGLTWWTTRPSISNHTIEKSKGFEILQDILEAVGIVALVVATILTDGAALLVVGAIAGLAQGGIQFGLAWYEENHQNDAPEINSLVSNLDLPVNWAAAGPFAVSEAGLHQGAFFLAGSLREESLKRKDLRLLVKNSKRSTKT